MLFNCGAGEDSWESLGQQGNQASCSKRISALNSHWKDWCWSWNSNTLVTWCEEPTHRKRPWCWERLRAKGEGGDKGWYSWTASLTQWTWVWANSGWQWRTGKPGVLQSLNHKATTEQQQGKLSSWLYEEIKDKENFLIKFTRQKHPRDNFNTLKIRYLVSQ